MKVREKEIFDARQWFPGKEIEGVEGVNENKLCGCLIAGGKHYNKPHVHVGEYYVLVEPGDWIITDKDGKREVMNTETFNKIYETI